MWDSIHHLGYREQHAPIRTTRIKAIGSPLQAIGPTTAARSSDSSVYEYPCGCFLASLARSWWFVGDAHLTDHHGPATIRQMFPVCAAGTRT